MDAKSLELRIKHDRAILEDAREGRIDDFAYGTGEQVFIKTPHTYEYYMCVECGLMANEKILTELKQQKFKHTKEDCKKTLERQPSEVQEILRELRIVVGSLYKDLDTPRIEDLKKQADTELKRHLVNLLEEYFNCKDEKRKRSLLAYLNEKFIELDDEDFKEKFRRLIK
ncbi:MAG: hypothetical protein J7J91_04395 [Deltaproteobacteria bacterium]|nr:hypothetical protein [Deltaproteobacteria bacterium]